MTLDPTTVGPVDVAEFAFEGDAFNGEIAPELASLAASGTVRIIDLAFIRKDAAGDASFLEVTDAEVDEAFAGLDDDQHDLLNDEDLLLLAEGLDPATAAMVVVWEHTWAAKLSQAIRGSGGTLVSHERIPHEIVVAAIDALDD